MRQTSKTVSPMSNEGRNLYVVEHITDAVLKLIQTTHLNDISISQICDEAGVGRASLGDLNMEDGNTYGSGINKLDISGGLGSIDIDFIEEN